MGIAWNYIKTGGSILAPGHYETDDNGKVQTVKLVGDLGDWVTLRYIDNVFGSAYGDRLALTTPADKNFGVISLNGGDDTLSLETAATFYLKLAGVEHVTGVAGATLKLAGPASFETDGSVSILANERNSAVQTVRFSDLVDDIVVNLGRGKDQVIFETAVSFGIDGSGRLAAYKDGHALTFDGYAANNSSLTIVVDGVGYTYAGLLASDLIDTAGPVVSIDGIATDTGATASIADGGLTKDATLELSGSVADASGVAAVHVFDGDTDLGAATLDGSGGWTFTTAALGEGAHTLTALATDVFGNSSESAAVAATIDTTAPTLLESAMSLVATTSSPDVFYFFFSEAVSGFDFSDLSVNNGHNLGSPDWFNEPVFFPDEFGPGYYMVRLSDDNTVASGDIITVVGVSDLAGNALAATEVAITVV